MKKVILSLLVFPLALAVSCTKQQLQDTPSSGASAPTSASQHARQMPCGPENPNNPYDNLGQIHNDGRCFVEAALKGVANPSLAQICEATAQFARVERNTVVNTDSLLRVLSASVGAYKPINYACAFQNLPCSPEAQQIMQDVFYSGFNTQNPESPTYYAAVKSNLVAKEAYYLEHNTLNDYEKRMVFGFAAITRYSLYYILNTAQPNSDGSYPTPNSFNWEVAWADGRGYSEAMRCGNVWDAWSMAVAFSDAAGRGNCVWNFGSC